MDLLREWCITKRTSGLSIPIPKATVATTTWANKTTTSLDVILSLKIIEKIHCSSSIWQMTCETFDREVCFQSLARPFCCFLEQADALLSQYLSTQENEWVPTSYKRIDYKRSSVFGQVHCTREKNQRKGKNDVSLDFPINPLIINPLTPKSD